MQIRVTDPLGMLPNPCYHIPPIVPPHLPIHRINDIPHHSIPTHTIQMNVRLPSSRRSLWEADEAQRFPVVRRQIHPLDPIRWQ